MLINDNMIDENLLILLEKLYQPELKLDDLLPLLFKRENLKRERLLELHIYAGESPIHKGMAELSYTGKNGEHPARLICLLKVDALLSPQKLNVTNSYHFNFNKLFTFESCLTGCSSEGGSLRLVLETGPPRPLLSPLFYEKLRSAKLAD